METSLNVNANQKPAVQETVETVGTVADASKATNTPSPLFNATPETAGSIASAGSSAGSTGGSSSCGSFSSMA